MHVILDLRRRSRAFGRKRDNPARTLRGRFRLREWSVQGARHRRPRKMSGMFDGRIQVSSRLRIEAPEIIVLQGKMDGEGGI